MKKTWRRLALLPVGVLALFFLSAFGYWWLMNVVEERPRSFLRSLSWASETLSSTGYGEDGAWEHPVTVAFVVIVQFVGQGFVLVMFPFVVLPYFEERFEMRLPTELPELSDFVFIYRHGATVNYLVDELEQHGIPVVIFEEDEAMARRLREQGRRVMFGRFDESEPDLRALQQARGVVANGPDVDNTAMILSARDQGYEGKIYAFVNSASHRRPLVLTGATYAYTPKQVLAEALAAKASPKISPRIVGLSELWPHLQAREYRVLADSELAGVLLGESMIHARTRATIVGLWDNGQINSSPDPNTCLDRGLILLAVGSPEALDRLAELAMPLPSKGPLVLLGFGEVGRRVAEMLAMVDEEVCVVERDDLPGAQVVGDALEPDVLRRAEVQNARAVIVALDSGSPTVLACALIRDLNPHAPLIARVNRHQDVLRAYRAGVDFALSFSDVACQLLLPQLVGDEGLEEKDPTLRISAHLPGNLVHETLARAQVRSRSGCSVVAIQRGSQFLVEFDVQTPIEADDYIYICATRSAQKQFIRYFEAERI